MNETSVQQLGNYLRTQREMRELSQRQLAAHSGINQSTVVRIERGDFCPGHDTLQALAHALDVPLTDLWNILGYDLQHELPGPMPFLRSKYHDLPEEKLQELTRDVAKVLKRHGIDPDGRPERHEDEHE